MPVAGTFGGLDSVFEHFLGFGGPAGAFQGLGGHKVSVGVVRMQLQQFGKLFERRLDLAKFGIFHRQAIASERVTRLLFEELGQHGKAIGVTHSQKNSTQSQARELRFEAWPAPFSIRPREVSASRGHSHSAFRLAPASAGPAAPRARKLFPMMPQYATSAI